MTSSVLTGKLTFRSLKPLDLSCCTREEIRDYFENSYDLTESLFTSLKDESVFYKCPDRLRLPLIFYFAHTAVVYINKLILADVIKERINLDFETMFETGVDEMSWDDTENYRMGGTFIWPSLREVVLYRIKVKSVVLEMIDDLPLTLPISINSPWWALLMGMEHERIHLETSSVLIRQLPVHMVSRPTEWIYGPLMAEIEVVDNPMIPVEGKEVCLGKPTDFPSYGWDNEYGQTDIIVPDFLANKFPVSNREFLEFVQSEGYTCRKHWSEEGWKWREFQNANHPQFWVCDRGCKGGCGGELKTYSHCYPSSVSTKTVNENGSLSQYRLRLMFDVVNLPLDWPVEVNYHEAKAYCKWKGKEYRLPTEAEHHLMRGALEVVTQGTICDTIYNDKIEANLNLQYGSSTPVNLYPENALGFHDVFGNVWEWCEDDFNGLDGFYTHWLYDDFSSPCFDGKHSMILGGSWISTGDETSRFARFAFRRHFFQHLGFRLAQTKYATGGQLTLPARFIKTPVFLSEQLYIGNPGNEEYGKYMVESTNVNYSYDTPHSLQGIMELEFGFRDSGLASVVTVCESFLQRSETVRDTAVHIGSGVGRVAFELSRTFKYVLGVEPVGRFVSAAVQLQQKQWLEYISSDTNTVKKIKLEDDINPQRIVFKQLTWLPNEVGCHDLVLITHLDRIQNPKAWVVRVWEITKESGVAVVASFSGYWNQKNLETILGKRMTCVADYEVAHRSISGNKAVIVTVWKRR